MVCNQRGSVLNQYQFPSRAELSLSVKNFAFEEYMQSHFKNLLLFLAK